jgi:hypothetical protein
MHRSIAAASSAAVRTCSHMSHAAADGVMISYQQHRSSYVTVTLCHMILQVVLLSLEDALNTRELLLMQFPPVPDPCSSAH